MKRLFIGLAVVVALATACGQSAQPTKGHASKPSPSPTANNVPARLQIPTLAIDAAVEQVGVDKYNDMDIPKQLPDVAWYKGAASFKPGVQPGQPGDAVIAGHKDSISGQHGVFWTLTNIKVGDELIVVAESGAKLRFKVTDSQSVSSNSNTAALGLFATSGAPRLTLITCTGQTNQQRTAYLSRLIVDASYEGQG